MMRWAFLISAVVEMCGAVIMYFYPEWVFAETPYVLNKFYGIAASVISVFNFSLYRYESHSGIWKNAVLAMMFFHAALAMVCYGAPNTILTMKTGACLTHLGLFVLFFMSYMKDLKPDKTE